MTEKNFGRSLHRGGHFPKWRNIGEVALALVFSAPILQRVAGGNRPDRARQSDGVFNRVEQSRGRKLRARTDRHLAGIQRWIAQARPFLFRARHAMTFPPIMQRKPVASMAIDSGFRFGARNLLATISVKPANAARTTD